MSCGTHNCSLSMYLYEQNRLFCRIMGPCYDMICVIRVHYDVILQCCEARQTGVSSKSYIYAQPYWLVHIPACSFIMARAFEVSHLLVN